MSPQTSFDDFQRAEARRVGDAGQARAAAADPNGLAEGVGIIKGFPVGAIISANDVRPLQRVGSPSILGPAFRAVARMGVIAPFGFTVADSVRSHQRIQRTWQVLK